jgi:hypothetical protein
MTYFLHCFKRTALAALRQWPIRNRFAIQSQPIVVSRRNCRAIPTFTLWPLRRDSKSFSRQPARASPDPYLN